MSADFHLCLDSFEFVPHALLDRDASHPESSQLVLGTDVREAKKVECLGFRESLSFSLSGRPTAELDEVGFLL